MNTISKMVVCAYKRRVPVGVLMSVFGLSRPKVWKMLHKEGVPKQRRGPAPNPILDDGTKWCERCKSFVLAERFHKDHSRGTLKSWCADCNKIGDLRRRYGITPEDYARMLQKQKNVCAICGLPQDEYREGKLRAFVVEHNHVTGNVRGLTHHRCNILLAKANERPEILRAAAAYLERGL